MWSKTKRNTHHSSKAAVIIINMYNDVKKSWATPHLFFCIFLGKWDMVQPFFSCVNIVCIILMSLKDNIWYFKLSSKNDPWLLGRPNHDRFCVCLSMYAFIPCIPYVWDVCSWSDAFLIVLHGGSRSDGTCPIPNTTGWNATQSQTFTEPLLCFTGN